ncbi:MAG TPA: PspC domain-containing protein, partial [Acidimicrobiales bacterium]
MSMVEPEPKTLPPPAEPPVNHRVWRSQERIVAGVAGGLAEALGVAPVWVRLGFVLLSVFAGLGVVVYVAAWLLLPAGPTASAPRVGRRVIGLLLVPFWLVTTHGEGGWGYIGGTAGVVLVLVGVGLAVWTPRSSPRAGTQPAVPAPPPPAETAAASRAPRPPRPPSPLGRVALGVGLLVAAVGTVATQGSSTGIKVAFGLATVVCGLGLLVGTLYGRARWLVVPAALFAGVSVVGAATENLGVHLSWSQQDTIWGPNFDGQPAPPARIDTGRGDIFV